MFEPKNQFESCNQALIRIESGLSTITKQNSVDICHVTSYAFFSLVHIMHVFACIWRLTLRNFSNVLISVFQEVVKAAYRLTLIEDMLDDILMTMTQNYTGLYTLEHLLFVI